MVKVQKISFIEPTLGFTEFDLLEKYRQSFALSELGRLHSLFPFSSLARSMGLKECRLGRKSYFSPEGKIALMVLKSYTGFSDASLIEHLNGNIHYQLFCDIQIDPAYPLTNSKIVSAIRNELAGKLHIESSQQILAEYWLPYLENLHVCMSDATCYESSVRYPTDMKLLWESIHWIYRQMSGQCRFLKIRRPRSKYDEVKLQYLSYSKKRKRKKSRTHMLKRRMLKLLKKLTTELEHIHKRYGQSLSLPASFHKRFSIIRSILVQQQDLFEGKKVTDRIVSTHKHYIRPIVRGKETKSVEFGAKVNNIQIDGISFIEHLSFKSFNEGIRLRDCIRLQQQLTHTRVRAVAADAIYATNANRKFCTRYGIITSFVRKGRVAKDEKLRKFLRAELSRERATRLEGSFGTQKQYYSLGKIKAGNKETERLWIFFGIHTANAVCMIQKVQRALSKETA